MNPPYTIVRTLETSRPPNCNEGQSRLAVSVVFTSLDGTAAALQSARAMARDLGAVIQLEAPVEVPWQLPLDRPPVPLAFTEQMLTKLVDRLELEEFAPGIHVYLCRNRLDALARVLRPESLVVIGGRRRWWPTVESRLARTLAGWGNRVTFVDAAGRSWLNLQ